ncbi:MAG: motility associated factor glycosyltransferase family protein [Bacillota bacterium]
MNYYNKNKNALNKNYPSIKTLLNKMEHQFEIEGNIVKNLVTGEEFLYKNFNQIVDVDYNNRSQIIFVGLQGTVNNIGRCEKIIIIEPNMSVFYALLHEFDFSDTFKRDNLIIIFQQLSSVFQAVNEFVDIQLNRVPEIVDNSYYKNNYPDMSKNLIDEIQNGLQYKRINLITNIRHSRKWRNNIIGNISNILDSPKADDFFDDLSGIPAIVVSNGPSLDKNIEDLKQAKDKAIIISAGSSTKALLNHGIEPDIVVSIDGKVENWEIHFEDIVDKIDDTILASELGNQYMINRNWKGPQLFFTMKRNFSGWIEDLKGEYETIRTGGTVAHSSAYLAYKLGCDPIVFVGQDLAFTDDKYHSEKSGYDGKEFDDYDTVEIDGWDGKVKTTKKYKTMIAYFESLFEQFDCKVIDATEGGCNFKGAENKKLKDVIDSFEGEINAKEILDELYKNKKPRFEDYKEDAQDKMAKTLQEINQAIDIAHKIILEVRGLISNLDDNGNWDNTRLSELENKIDQFDNVKYFTERVLIPEIMEYNEATKRMYLSEKNKQEKILRKYNEYRRAFKKELENCRDMILDEYSYVE